MVKQKEIKDKPKPIVRDKLEVYFNDEGNLVAGFISRMCEHGIGPQSIGRGVADLMMVFDKELYIK